MLPNNKNYAWWNNRSNGQDRYKLLATTEHVFQFLSFIARLLGGLHTTFSNTLQYNHLEGKNPTRNHF